MVTTRKVRFNDGIYYSLSNFSAHQIVINGHVWPTSEHAYQQSKFLKTIRGYEIRYQIKNAASPAKAKEIAHQNRDKYRKEWSFLNFKVYVMHQILRAKAQQHQEVRFALFLTRDREIVELHPRELFWAGDSKDSLNWLGRCWMLVRSEIQQEIQQEFNKNQKSA